MILTEIHIWEENKSVITMFVYWLSNTDHFIEIRQLNDFLTTFLSILNTTIKNM